MTESLWYHALRFLDKYRTDAANWDVEELYKFADETGILERHKQLLAKPYHDNQVDMKIMYYELIKMLISYERKHHPEQYDATKGVGKIEGYQELTNKLQRYLNQRFIEDIDKINGQIVNLNEININQKFEVYQENFSRLEARISSVETQNINLEARNQELTVQVTGLEGVVSSLQVNNDRLTAQVDQNLTSIQSLQQQINILKEKNIDLEELIERVEKSRSSQEVEQSSVNQAVRDLLQTEKQERILLDERVSFLTETDKIQNDRFEGLDREVDSLKDKLTNNQTTIQETHTQLSSRITHVEELAINLEQNITTSFRQQQAEELETLGKRVDAIAEDMTNFGKTTNDNLAAINDRLTSHDQAIASIHDHDIATLTHRTDALENDLALVKVEVTGNTANITTNTNNITNITTNITTNTTNISSMNESITNIFQTLNKMNTKTAEQFDKIEDSLQQHRDSIHVTIKEMTEDNAKIRGIESQVAGLTDGHNGMRNDISKIEADLLNLNAVTQQCNTKVEEVTVLATNIDVHVKAQEKMIQQQADGDLKDIKAKIAELQELGTNYLSFRSEYVEPMHGQLSVIQQKLVQNADDAENTKTSYKTLIAGLQADIEGQIKLIKDEQIEHKEELHNAAEEFERLSQEIDSLKGNINNISTTINEQLNIKFVSNRDELLNKIEEVEGKINNNHTAIANNAETFNDNMNKLKESLDKVSLNLNEQIVFNIESSNQGFESKIGDIYAKIQKNEEDIVNNNTSLNKEINILKESIENMSTNFGEQIEANITSHKESYNSMFGEIEDKLKKLHEEQLNCKDELSNAAEEFESINKELESLRENLQITTTSFTEKLNVNITSNNEAIDVRFGDLDEKINKASICINNVSETSKQDIIKLREDLDSITANAREELEITINSNRESVSGEIENMNGRITNNETDISNLKDGAAEQSKKFQEALDNMSVSVDEKIEVNKNAINVTIKEIAEDNDKIRSIENELSGMVENLNNANASILQLKTDISNLDAVTQQFETKVEEVTVLATNIDVHVKAQEQMIQQQTEGDMNKINERITILEQKLNQNADEVDNSRNTYKILIEEMQAEIDGQIKLVKDEQVNHKEELHNAAEEFERLAKELEDIKANLTNVSASFNEQLEVNIVSNKENLDQTLGDINSRIKKNTDEIENISNKMKENIMEDVEVKVNQVRENIQINIESSNEKVLQHLSEEVDALKALVADLRVKEQDNLSEAIKMLEQQLETLKQNIEISVNVAQKDSQENLKSKLDEMDEKLQDVLNKNQENINLVVNMKEENNIQMKSNSDDLKNEINDKLTDLTIMIENLKTLEKEDNEMVIKLVDDRNSKINTDLEKMMVDLHNKLDEQKDNFNVSIELSQQNIQGSLLTIIDQIKYDLDSLKQKEQEGKDLIIIDLQNKFDKFKDEINLVIDDSKQFSEGTNRDIAALQILIDDLKQKQKEDYDVILQISNDQDAKNRNDTNKLIENLVTKINSLKDNMDSSVADQMEEMKLTINDLRSQTTNDIKIFLDKNEEKTTENLVELKKQLSELEKDVEDLKKKMKEDMDVVFQLNQESEKKNSDAGEKLLIELENKIASLKDSIDININMSKDDTAEKIKAIQRSLDDLKKKEDEQIEVVVNDIDKKLDAIKQEININIDNSKSSDESFTKKINELTLQIQGLVEKDHSNETLIVNLEKDTSDKLKGLSNLLEEVRKQGADDIQVIIAANAEKNEDALSNLKFLQEKIDEIAKDLDDLKNKEKQDYDVVIQLNNDKFNQLKENENNLKKDIDSKIASIQENINVTIIKSENKIEEEMKENLEKIKNDLEELKKQEAKNINESIANMDEKIAKIQENVEVTINVSQKAAEQNLSAKIEEIEKELRSMKENEQETLEGVITDLENKMKALKENIEVNINMTQNNYEEEIKNKLNHISIDLQDLKNKEVENENELKRATDEVKGNVDKEIKEINNKLEISINDLRNKTKAENEELDKSTKEDIERIDALCITLRALFDELKEKKKEDLELLLKINHDNAEEAKNTADNMMKEVESRILMMKDNIEININNTQKNIEDGLSKKVDDLSIVVEDLKKKEHEDMTIIINNIDEKMKHQQENNDENLLEKLEELRKQFEQKDKDNMDIVIQMDQANKDNTMQALEDKVNEIKKEIQLNINILNEKYDKNFNDSGIEVSMLADKLSDLEKSGDLLNSSLANISLEIEDKFKGDYAALRLRIEDLEKVKDQISELDDSITLLQPDVAGNKESIASLRLFESKQIKDFDELKKHSQEMLIVHRSEVDAKLKELFGLRDTQDQHGKEYKAFVESIMVQLEGLVIENTTQNDKMGKLDDFTKNMDEKFKELEQADSFLQETHMDLTKRTQFVETEIKRVEAASLALIKDQRTDAEELKVELKKVDSKTNPFFDRFEELQNQITLNKGGIVENSEKISYNTNGIQDITEILNNLKQKVEINIEDISLNKQHIQKNVGDFNVRLDDIHGDINSNFDEKLEKLNVLFNETMDAHAKGEDAKHQKISNTCTMLEMDLNSTNEKLSKLDGLHQQLKDQLAGQNSQYSEAMQQFRGQLDGLNVQHTETIQQMKEVTVLATNIDVHVKEQQAQQAIDTTNYDEKINEVKGFADDLSRDFIALSERLKTFDELSKNQGERILLIERLGDQLEQLSEETREDKQSIKSLWDEFHNQRERSNYFDGLMNKYDSERQQSEAKTKEEINITVQSNNKALTELNETLSSRLLNLEGLLAQVRQESANQQGSQETRIVESHNTLISRLEKIEMSHKETIQKIVSDQSGGLSDLQAGLEHRIQQLANLCDGQGRQVEQNTAKLAAIMADVNRDFDGVRQELANFKVEERDERDLIVTRIETRIKENTNTLESHFQSLESRMESFQSSHSSEVSRMEKVEKYILERIQEDDNLLRRLDAVEKLGAEHDRLLVELDETVGHKTSRIESDLGRYRDTHTEQLRSLRADVQNDKENFWTLLVEIYSAFRGSTVVLKSEGIVREHQADVLGVYRMVDHYNDRPVYKQDGGENFIYYSATSASWLVGTVVGHQYGWLRNGSDSAQARRWIPDLESGWEYRPLTRSSELSNTWCTDDGTLRIESLREVEKVNELLRDIKNAHEID